MDQYPVDPNPCLTPEEFTKSLERDAIGHMFKMRATNQVVRIVRRIRTPPGQVGLWWDVEDLVLGHIFACAISQFGDELNEMEALAWISS